MYMYMIYMTDAGCKAINSEPSHATRLGHDPSGMPALYLLLCCPVRLDIEYI